MSYKKYIANLQKLGILTTPFNFGRERDNNGNITADGKAGNIDDMTSYDLIRTQQMFEYEGLPDTIPQKDAELLFQCTGYGLAFQNPDDGNWYLTTGGTDGELDPNCNPTIGTIANPALGYSGNIKIEGWKYVKNQAQYAGMAEGVLIRNDPLMMGLLPLLRKYNTLMAETELSIWMADINCRILSYLSASDSNTHDSAEKYLQDMTDGKLGVIAESAFLEGIKSQPNSNSATAGIMQGLIEMEQFLKASKFNEIGLNANYNMKRESINSQEAQLNDDALLPLVDEMLKCRQIGWDKFNELSGMHVKVKLASSWEDNAQEIAITHEEMEAGGEPLDEAHENDPAEEEKTEANEEEENAGTKEEV